MLNLIPKINECQINLALLVCDLYNYIHLPYLEDFSCTNICYFPLVAGDANVGFAKPSLDDINTNYLAPSTKIVTHSTRLSSVV